MRMDDSKVRGLEEIVGHPRLPLCCSICQTKVNRHCCQAHSTVPKDYYTFVRVCVCVCVCVCCMTKFFKRVHLLRQCALTHCSLYQHTYTDCKSKVLNHFYLLAGYCKQPDCSSWFPKQDRFLTDNRSDCLIRVQKNCDNCHVTRAFCPLSLQNTDTCKNYRNAIHSVVDYRISSDEVTDEKEVEMTKLVFFLEANSTVQV